ncbi:uncharacterized protein LOC122068595 [Macadamia integrifolia]|uniref:uncharacterized protein LOC122068595 n=1 Tax=Macadamia integrifolia TaxID=60698 RepID=UPI001C4FB2CD|nr:uncharacterized protein LOC122068595 [Macadamia integrifolia]
MNSSLLSASSSSLTTNLSTRSYGMDFSGLKKQYPVRISNLFLNISFSAENLTVKSRFKTSRSTVICLTGEVKPSESVSMNRGSEGEIANGFSLQDEGESKLNVVVGKPSVPAFLPVAKLSLADQAFFLLAFIACTTSVAFTSLVIAAVPTLYAMGRAATSLSKLADTAREELPSTMAAIRLSGMEISDLTLELSDLSQEIAEGVNKSAQAVQAAEAGIRQIGSLARQQTISMIQERASLPIISLQPVVAGAAKKTSRAVGQATKTFMNIISRREFSPEDEDSGIDRVEL